MTAPLSFPSINPGPVIQDQGTGGAIASALAQVLAAQQHQQEQQWRQQQLEHQWAMEQANLQVSQGNLAVNQGQLSAQTTEAANKTNALRQVGGSQQAALGIGQPQPQVPGQPTLSPGPTPPPNPFQQVIGGGAQAAKGAPEIFAGVSPENMPAAVQGVQEIQKLTPQAPELPTSAKEFQFVQHLAQLDPTGQAAKFFVDNWVKKPGVTVNNNAAKAETKFATEMATGDVAAQEDIVKQANQAAASFPSMNEAYNLFKSGNVIAGMGAKQVLGINRVLATMGVDTAKNKVTDTQTATKLLRDGVLAQLQTRALGSGTAVSDADRNYMEQVQGADLTQQPDAIKRIIRINVGLGVERMVSAKMLLEQQVQDHPESKNVLQGKIKLIERKMAPVWKQYQTMLTEETKQQSQTQMNVGGTANQLFPVR